MLVNTIICGAFMATVAMSHVVDLPREPSRLCGNKPPSPELLAAAEELAQEEGELDPSTFKTTPTKVDTYFHVIAKSKNESEGYLSDATLKKQLDVINADYAKTPFQFVLKNTTRTINPKWAKVEVTDPNTWRPAKKDLRQGDYKTLNVYFFPEMTYLGRPGLLGWCEFPENVTAGSTEFIDDGCASLSSTVPGGSSAPFNMGRTTTHEIGHWFGIFHVFDDDWPFTCDNHDQVADTPMQMSPSYGCPKGKDSCPQNPGLDSIHNFMDYTDDACMTEFTPGQAKRMTSMWKKFRL